MKINLVSVEDGIDNIGFRKLSAFVKQLYPETGIHYVTTGNFRSLTRVLAMGGVEPLGADEILAIAGEIAAADILGFSSMTPYAATTAAIIAAVRSLNPRAVIVWGGIHGIVEPEDAILHADAVCTGEGEFAFQRFIAACSTGGPLAGTPGFWVRTAGGIVKSANLPLMTGEEMDSLPLPTYQAGELIYKAGQGFVPLQPLDYVDRCGLAYSTVWSIGCPMNCVYCSNSKFIEYDSNYRKVRHSSPATIINEIKAALEKHPHISTIVFHDDNFIALPLQVLAEFCDLYCREIRLPFAVIGLSPGQVTMEKMKLLVSAGMNRVRMGIQSGSQRILDFYERGTAVSRVRESCEIINCFSRSMIPPAYDIILDNPLETLADTIATLDMIHSMPRPFTLNLFALRVIPNTRLAASLAELHISLPDIRLTLPNHRATFANLMIYLLIFFKLPEGIYKKLCQRVVPSHADTKLYPRLLMVLRLFYLTGRAFSHLRVLDFTVITGRAGYLLWRFGVVGFRRRHMQRGV